MDLLCGMVHCNFLSLSFQSGSPKKPAVSGDGTESSGEGEGMGAIRAMNKPPDKPEQPTVVRRATLMINEKPGLL